LALSLVLVVSAGAACERSESPPKQLTAPALQNLPPMPERTPLDDPALLTGEIVDYHGRPLAGAMVTARDDKRAMSVSVFTDGHGHYAFPELDAGTWRVRVKIVGFERREREIQLAAPALDVDFQLRLDEAPHEALPASYFYARIEWPEPGMRENFALACANCHQIGDPLWRKPRTAADWEAVVARMEFRGPPLRPEVREILIPTMLASFESYSQEDFELPGPPTGEATRAILWEFEVDPQGRNGCHDLEIAPNGVLYTEDGFAVNPETFERWHHTLPRGAHSIEGAPNGDMWVTVTGTDQMTKLDTKTGEVTNLEHPLIGDDQGVYPHTLRFDDAGYIWYTLTVSNHVARLDPRTGEFVYYDLPVPEEWDGPWPIPVAYGLDVAPDQTIWWSQLLGNRIGVLDPESGEVRAWKTPFPGPRRLRVGADGVVWVPGYGSGVLGRFDPRTEEWKVYDLPTEPKGTELPYALAVNRRTGDVWIAGSNSDTLIRFIPAEERFVAYPMATSVDFAREIEFDDQDAVWTCVPDRGTGPEGPLSGRFVKLELLDRVGSCGDGTIQLGEQCDDGNLDAGDDCTPECQLAPITGTRVAFQD
jgi:cysteine-rich repeat protein